MSSDDTQGKGCPLDTRIARFHQAAELAGQARAIEDWKLRAEHPEATEQELRRMTWERGTLWRVLKTAFNYEAQPVPPRREHWRRRMRA
jgi:hypothetical protein